MKTLPLVRPSPARRRANSSSVWRKVQKNGLLVQQIAAFAKIPWLVHGFSTRPGGASEINGELVLNLGFTEWDRRESVQENRARFQSLLGGGDFVLALLRQIHSDVIHLFEKVPSRPFRGDVSLTTHPGLLLGVQTADCVPILLVDPRRRAVAAIHAGWRGTLRRIAAKTVGRMQMAFGSRPEDLLAALGPAIGGCCYEVGAELAAAFHSQFARAGEWFGELRTGEEPNPLQWINRMPPGHQPPPKNVLLDLREANRAQLLDVGLRDTNIFVSDLCTACRTDLFFSYRKEGARTGRLLSVVGIRPS